jgi:hypothetical protein
MQRSLRFKAGTDHANADPLVFVSGLSDEGHMAADGKIVKERGANSAYATLIDSDQPRQFAHIPNQHRCPRRQKLRPQFIGRRM